MGFRINKNNILLPKELIYRYSLKEDILNTSSHGIAAILSYLGLIYLVYTSAVNGDIIDVIACSVYGSSLVYMFLMSTFYHGIFNDLTRSVFKRLDHTAIFILITGTYTPFTFSVINTTEGYIIYSILFLLMIMGIIFKIFYAGRFKKMSTMVYVMMGWVAIFEMQPLIVKSDQETLLLLLIGGIIYSVGAIIYACTNFKYHHFIWHLFVVIAAVIHFIAIVTIFI